MTQKKSANFNSYVQKKFVVFVVHVDMLPELSYSTFLLVL